MRAGVTCYLGVNVEGALFSIGDGHCRQGEGESCGVAVEAAMDTVVAVDLVKGVATPWPRLESDTHLMSTGSARPLEDAFRISQVDLVQWIAEAWGLDQLDAYQLLTQAVEAPVANVVDPNYTFVSKLRKDLLPATELYRGTHGRLRQLGRDHLAGGAEPARPAAGRTTLGYGSGRTSVGRRGTVPPCVWSLSSSSPSSRPIHRVPARSPCGAMGRARTSSTWCCRWAGNGASAGPRAAGATRVGPAGAAGTDPRPGQRLGDRLVGRGGGRCRAGGPGRLLPAASPDGYGAWRVGPLDATDLDWLRRIAAAMPPQGHALPVDRRRPLRLRSPEMLVRELWDAIADTLVRTPAAVHASGARAFAAVEPVTVGELAGWLAETRQGLDAGAQVQLRVELPLKDEEPFAAVVQVRSAADPSLVVDAGELWSAPAAVLARLGERAETDLLLALRRGARAWPPLAPLLRSAAPTEVSLDEEQLSELLETGAEALGGAGIEVLWPAELLGEGLDVRATVATPTPAGAAKAAFGLETLLRFDWQVTMGGEVLTAEEVAALAEAKRPLVRLRGRWVRVNRELLERLRRRRGPRITAAEALAAALTGSLVVDGDRVEFRAAGALADLVDRLAGVGRAAVAPPADLRATLRPYQRRGLSWLAQMCELGLGGCLADDMGLGKTVQVIALHLHRRPLEVGPTLVVCPTSLLGNWQRELARFAPDVPVRRYHGGGRHLERLAADEVVLVTYGVVRRDRPVLAEVGWGLVVADEAQHAKNPCRAPPGSCAPSRRRPGWP